MEYVEGETLAQWLRKLKEAAPETETPFGTKDEVGYYAGIAKAFADVADGLQHAHSKGVIHRDIKPSNLILDSDGRLRILDFGLARLEGQESLTLSGDFVGTPAYMSPEQARRQKLPVDHRTDIYSLGATLYELLTHQQLFRGKDHNDTLSQIIERDPRPPRQLNGRVPQDLETIVLKCLRKEAEARYASAEALAQDLRRFARGDAIEARPQAAWEGIARKLWRHRIAVIALGVAVVVILIALSAGALLLDRARETAERERDRARESLYVAQVGRALEAWEHGHVARFEELLDALTPEEGDHDLRGWEWHYLSNLRTQALLRLPGKEGWGGHLAWAPHGDRLAVQRSGKILEIWETTTPRSALRLEKELGNVGRIAWSPDGSRVATAGRRGVVTIWEVESGTTTIQLEYPVSTRTDGNGVRALAWSPDGLLLASGGNQNVPLVLWNTAEGVVHRTITEEPADVCAWSPDGAELAVVAQRSRLRGILTIWSLDGRKVADWQIAPGAKSVAWSRDASMLAVGGMEGSIVLLERSSGDEVATLQGHAGEIRSIDWDHKRDRLVSGGAGGLVKIWDPRSGASVATLRGHQGWVKSVAWSADGRLVASSGDDDDVLVWDDQQTGPARTVPGISPAAWGHRGQFLATASDEGGAHVLESDTGELVVHLGAGGAVCLSVAWSVDDRYLALGRADGIVEVWDVTRRAQIFTEVAHGDVRAVAWSANGTLATGGRKLTPPTAGKRVRLWDVPQGTEIFALSDRPLEPYEGIGSLSWSPNGLLLAALEKFPVLYVWDVQSRRELHRLPTIDGYGWGQRGQSALAWSPEGDRLAVGTVEGSIAIWDIESGEQLLRSHGHASRILTVAWSPDGRRLASGGDGGVRLWRVRDDRLTLLLTLRHHTAPVFSLAWSPDGRRLLSASRLRVALWEAPDYELAAGPGG